MLTVFNICKNILIKQEIILENCIRKLLNYIVFYDIKDMKMNKSGGQKFMIVSKRSTFFFPNNNYM